MVALKIQLDCSTVHDTTLWANIYVRSNVGCGTDSVFIRFLQVSQIFQRRKSDANKHDFENKLNLTCQAQSTPKTIGILTKVFWTSGPNSAALSWTDDELSPGQAQNGVNFDFEGKFDLEGKVQSPRKTIGTLTKVFYIYGSNLVILAWTGLELSRGQASDWHTDGQTDAGNDNTRWPYRPRVKMKLYINVSSKNSIHKELIPPFIIQGQPYYCSLIHFPWHHWCSTPTKSTVTK